MSSKFEERIRKIITDFKNGCLKYKPTIKRIMKVVSEAEHEAYQEGYNDGYRQGEKEGYQDAINEGVEDFYKGYQSAIETIERFIELSSSIPHDMKEKIYEIIDRAKYSV